MVLEVFFKLNDPAILCEVPANSTEGFGHTRIALPTFTERGGAVSPKVPGRSRV